MREPKEATQGLDALPGILRHVDEGGGRAFRVVQPLVDPVRQGVGEGVRTFAMVSTRMTAKICGAHTYFKGSGRGNHGGCLASMYAIRI